MANRGWLRCGQWLLAALVLTAAALLLQALRTGALVETGMQSLVPASHAVDEAELRAEAQGERLLNQQMVLLVGAPDARQAAATAEELAQRWRASGLFAEVREKLLPDLSVLQKQLSPLQLALMPTDVLDQLRTDPAAYFLQRAQDRSADPRCFRWRTTGWGWDVSCWGGCPVTTGCAGMLQLEPCKARMRD